MSDTVKQFGYARGVAPPMWILFGLGLIELLVAHLLLSHWWPRFAVAIGLLTGASLLWLAWTIASFGRLPVLVDGDRVVMRAGRLKLLKVPRIAVGEVLRNWPPELLKDRGTANLALLAYPNIAVRLRSPVTWRGRSIRTIAHKLDDPDGFARALSEQAV